MESSNLIIIIAAEVCALLILLCMFLLFKNRSLRGLISKLQARMEQLVQDLRQARSQKSMPAQDIGAEVYKKHLEAQLKLTKSHHESLGPEQDIMLDIDPEVPLPRRAAALRHALLTIELEAGANHQGNKPNWKTFNQKYQQLFSFQQDYSSPGSSDESQLTEEINNLTEELTSAKKRINNLEKFKALYFELEDKWQSCKDQAQNRYDELSGMVARLEDSQPLEQALNAYHSVYADVSELLERGVETSTTPLSNSEDSVGEIRHLRAVAADQHRIINELQRKLEGANSDEQRQEVVNELQTQLQKQIRFVQESETCIQLMEDELSNAHKELEQLQNRLGILPQLKSELKELREVKEEHEMQIYTLKAANQRINRELKAMNAKSKTEDKGEAQKLKKALAEMEAKYANLEEKFLDLKIRG